MANELKIEGYAGTAAVVMGYLKRENQKISKADFNKLIKGYGYDSVTMDEIKSLAEEINNDTLLSTAYHMALEGKLTLDDVQPITPETAVKEADVFSMVTPYIMEKQGSMEFLREFRKLQRDGTALKILMEDLKESLAEELKDLPTPKYLKTGQMIQRFHNGKALIIAFSDWHVGLETFGSRTGNYNFERLATSVNSIVDWALEQMNERTFEEVHVVFLGDLIENQVMRNTQSFDLEFHMAAQISKSLKLITEMLLKLSEKQHIHFSMVTGNHSRFFQNKNDNLHNNNVEYIVLDNLFMLQETLGQLPNVTLHDNREDMDRFDIDVVGHRIVGVHGDKMPKGKEKIPVYMKDGIEISILLSGHLHSTEIVQESYSRLHTQVGSTVGENDYSRSLNCPITSPAQMAIVLTRGRHTKELTPLILGENGEIA
ncbi:DNA double-strand break repair protein [Bacillus phage Kamfam]|nr:hypothetical protein OTK52_193 [Bacillus phage OTooleKemple52]AXQ67142.1 DNA double-strand break repair protein [Bacillus phage Kamfam]